ncbi:hypothetical protein pEaSNUABM50_00063 [Erwinia phage pEa_SNUABM_50]|uniref:Uncharacterized protein n=4 Tax=Eneladusvirus BF TaxID=2560751 RepID=A0A7L8ZMV6_9CAUD|nr:hypothetical protein FDH34_gp065 [Serratia phage BF]QOI71003.1 hypothetical protein pEaSNUABM12_00065 [Erwinia phage pEa_SNUABM_12]QOI71548.1 hypothetical protein pEaSNUABM47_00064 [Erwinia phage pEa_SNUABM_47]QOI72087.1 hypothetical protein pEaSNUABM50_00063 [Erwinia phage pEa_SNUABM_50]QXO12311.1 hypothetical protein pEaSNUABM49_00065 [Erwinia phage pEa_SNUABM_49]AQW88590.1 hypothetical protein BF_0065 [Serratia phage BF]
MLYKLNQMFWDENESTGYRHVSVEYNGRVLMAVTAHNVSKVWSSRIIPMGFSFELDEVEAFSGLFEVLPSLMKFMCTESLSSEEMQNFLLTIQ